MIALVLALLVSRPFHHETVDSLKTSRHTHVQVAGTVFRVSDAHGHFIVCEIVPYHPLERPRVGQAVVVFGIRRADNEAGHGWAEVHPVERWIEAVP